MDNRINADDLIVGTCYISLNERVTKDQKLGKYISTGFIGGHQSDPLIGLRFEGHTPEDKIKGKIVEIYPNERKDTYFSVYDCDESIDGGRKKRKSTKRKRKNRKLTKRKRKKSK